MSSPSLPPSPEQCLVVGFGGICLDDLAVVPALPVPGDRIQSRSVEVQGIGEAANALTCLARLGVRARLISKIADDIPGKRILEELTADRVDTSFLVLRIASHMIGTATIHQPCIIPNRRFRKRSYKQVLFLSFIHCYPGFFCLLVAKDGQTPSSFVMVDQSTRARSSIFTPAFLVMEPADISQMNLKSALEGARFVYFDARHTDTAIVIAQEAAGQNMPILLHAEKKRLELVDLLQLSDYAVCSAEFPQAWTDAPSMPSALISMLLEFPKLKFATVTLGEHGCLMLERSSDENSLMGEEDADSLLHSLEQKKDDRVATPMCIPSEVVKLKANGIGTLMGRLFVCTAERIPPSELVDTTVAGDAFIGAILYALCMNMTPENMLPFAATVAAAACKGSGARTGLPYRTDPCLAPYLDEPAIL